MMQLKIPFPIFPSVALQELCLHSFLYCGGPASLDAFHTINHIIYHTSLDTPELVPAEGQERATRAFASIVDHVNQMTIAQIKGPGWPYGGSTGSINGAIGGGKTPRPPRP